MSNEQIDVAAKEDEEKNVEIFNIEVVDEDSPKHDGLTISFENSDIPDPLVINGKDENSPNATMRGQQIRRSHSCSHLETTNLHVPGNASGSQSPSELSLPLVKPLSAVLGCEMCSNYETRMQQLQVTSMFIFNALLCIFHPFCFESCTNLVSNVKSLSLLFAPSLAPLKITYLCSVY